MPSTSPSFCSVAGHDEALHLHFVVKPVGEERPDRPIDEPGGQGFFGRRPAFALEKAAGKLAGGGRALAIIAGQREEIECPARGGAGGRGGRDTTVSPYWTRQLPAACLASSPVSIERTLAPICFSTRTFNVSFLPSFASSDHGVGSTFNGPLRAAPQRGRGHCIRTRARQTREDVASGSGTRLLSRLTDYQFTVGMSRHRLGRLRHSYAAPHADLVPCVEHDSRQFPAPPGINRKTISPAVRKGPDFAIHLRCFTCADVLADVQTANDVEIALRIDRFKVIQQPTAATDHHQQAPPTGVVLLVRSQVLRQFADPGRQNGDLYLGRARYPSPPD